MKTGTIAKAIAVTAVAVAISAIVIYAVTSDFAPDFEFDDIKDEDW
jgi:hypothetical protein